MQSASEASGAAQRVSTPEAPFVPRPFPPPSLADVPMEYIMDQLHGLASQYWDQPDTADCTIIVPVPYLNPASFFGGPTSCSPFDIMPASATTYNPSGLGRRASEPTLQFAPRISLKLHIDYLSAHSSFLRGLFSGASPLDLITTTPEELPVYNTGPSGPLNVPANRLPRLMPSTPDHPVLFLPIPDPTSFHLLVHWMYFGHTHFIEECLLQGVVQWEGLARNVEYLGLTADIKIFLGRWYGDWLRPEAEESEVASDDESTAETVIDGDDVGESLGDGLAKLQLDEPAFISDGAGKDDLRGRDRAVRPVSLSAIDVSALPVFD
ncbi:hypothetical protein BD626DRAFT_157697 [Schizophyllum amplum]|uniref:BTB domain-containing protein n=1 Tax=Schizophyllum amplum TaxID=97359 RepID=A0A550C399_9AGAR|nr:hypothetical protein BD626DRAFT_157697 [Auriculariopsis ampla]